MERLVEKVREAAEAAANGPTGSYADVPYAVREAWDALVTELVRHGVPASGVDRDALGRLVREVWVVWARANPLKCHTCEGAGTQQPVCAQCDAGVDGVEEHECPASVTCLLCKGTGKRLKDSWLVPWENLSDEQREVDRRIGEAVGVYALALVATLPTRLSKSSLLHMQAVLAGLHTRQGNTP